MKLLIVDDSNMIRVRIASLIRDVRLNKNIEIVGLARDGASALQLATQHQPELMTLDLTMPEMDGLECIQGITNINEDANILVVSALSDKASGIRALEYGARGFIYKPFSVEDMFSELKELLED